MKPKDLLVKLIAEIDSDGIGNILIHAQELITDDVIAVKVLVSLNKLLYNAVRENITCKSSVDDIVQLSNLCCVVLLKKWNPSIHKTKVYRCLFHVNNYILFKEHFHHLEQFYNFIFAIHDKPTEEKNDEEEKNILQCFTPYVATHINKSLNKLSKCLVSENELSLIKLCKILFKLDHVCDFITNDICLNLVTHISQVCQAAHHPELLLFQKEVFNLLSPQSVKDYVKLVKLVYSFLAQILQLNSPIAEINFLLSFIRTFENSVEADKNLFCFCVNIITLMVSNLEETQFMEVAHECNLLLKNWVDNKETSIAIYNACSCSIFTMMKIHKNWFERIAKFNLVSNKLETIFNLLNNFYNIFKMQPYELCILPSGEKCLLKEDVINLVHCQYLILTLISSGDRAQIDISICYPIATNAQQECLKWIDEARNKRCLKLNNIASWAYTAMVRFSRWLTSSDDLTFIKTTFKAMLNLPTEIVHTSDFTMKGLSLVACLSDKLQKNGNLNESLKALIAFLCVWRNSESSIFSFWTDLKHNQMLTGSDQHLNLTVHDIIENKKEQDWIELNFVEAEVIKYLYTEIKMYYKNSLHRGSQLISAFSELRKRTGDVAIISKALVMAMEVSSSSDVFLTDMKRHQELSSQLLLMLRETVLKKKPNVFKLKFLIGDLLFQQFRCDLRLTRNKSEWEISLSVGQINRANTNKYQSIEDTNPDDTCQVNTIYETLSVKTQQNMLKKIDEAFVYWDSACAKIKSDMFLGDPDQVEVTLENIWNAGLIYKLFYVEDKKIVMFRLLYTLADLVSCHEMKILAASELLGVDLDFPSKYIEDCIQVISKQDIKPKIKLIFEMSYIKYCFMHNEIAEGMSILLNLNKQWRSYSLTNILALLKMNKFGDILSKTDSAGYVAYDVIGLQIILQMCLAYMNKENEYRNFSDLTQIHDIGLQSSYDIGMIYWLIKLPRLARCYLKAQINIAQKLVLPLRTAQLLTLLTWVDLDCRNSADAAIKLEGLEAILDISATGTIARANSSSSPEFKISSISVPDFVKHENTCECFACTSDEYQRLVLEAITLRAEYDGLIGENMKAINDFKVGMKVLDKIFKNRTKSYDSLDGSRVNFWIRYAEFQASSEDYTGAIETYRKAKSYLKPKDQYNLTKILVMLYNLPLISAEKTAPKSKIPVIIVNTPERKRNFKIPKGVEMKNYKTPKIISKPITSEKSPLSVVNRRITPKGPTRILFAYSSDDESDTEVSKENKPVEQKKPKPLSNMKTKPLPDIVIKSPSAILSSLKKEREPFTVFSDEVGVISSVTKTYRRNRMDKKEETNVIEPNSAIKKTGARRKLLNNEDTDENQPTSLVKTSGVSTRLKKKVDIKINEPSSLVKKTYGRRQTRNKDETSKNEPLVSVKKIDAKTQMKKREETKVSDPHSLTRNICRRRLNTKEEMNLNAPGSSKPT